MSSSQNPSGPAHWPLVSASLSWSCTFFRPASTGRQFGVPSLQTAKAGAAGTAPHSAPAMMAPLPMSVATLECVVGFFMCQAASPSWAHCNIRDQEATVQSPGDLNIRGGAHAGREC